MPDFSPHRLRSLIVLAIGATCLSAAPAEAARRLHPKAVHAAKAPGVPAAKSARLDTQSIEAKAAEIKSATKEPTGVWTSGEQERACFRGRRKLWQPGEGWVVKKVNLCP